MRRVCHRSALASCKKRTRGIPSLKASSQRKTPPNYAHTAGSLQEPNGKFLHKANPKGMTNFLLKLFAHLCLHCIIKTLKGQRFLV